MRKSTDKTVLRTIEFVKQSCPKTKLQGIGSYDWYDITGQGLSAEVTLLRQAGVLAHHPTVHTLVRFDE